MGVIVLPSVYKHRGECGVGGWVVNRWMMMMMMMMAEGKERMMVVVIVLLTQGDGSV